MSLEQETALPHSLTLEERTTLTITGVRKIRYYDEEGAQLDTDQGRLTISGSGLQMGELSTRSGKVELSGQVDALEYSREPGKSGLFGRRKP